MSRWKAFKAYCAWHVYEYGTKRYTTFTTWDKAMDYADRETQPTPNTITIQDPTGVVCDLTATINPHNHIHLKTGEDTFTLVPHEWKPLARFLLDVDNRKEHE